MRAVEGAAVWLAAALATLAGEGATGLPGWAWLAGLAVVAGLGVASPRFPMGRAGAVVVVVTGLGCLGSQVPGVSVGRALQVAFLVAVAGRARWTGRAGGLRCAAWGALAGLGAGWALGAEPGLGSAAHWFDGPVAGRVRLAIVQGDPSLTAAMGLALMAAFFRLMGGAAREPDGVGWGDAVGFLMAGVVTATTLSRTAAAGVVAGVASVLARKTAGVICLGRGSGGGGGSGSEAGREGGGGVEAGSGPGGGVCSAAGSEDTGGFGSEEASEAGSGADTGSVVVEEQAGRGWAAIWAWAPLAGLVMVAGNPWLWQRLGEGASAGAGTLAHRLFLWAAGGRMVAAFPWSGLGPGVAPLALPAFVEPDRLEPWALLTRVDSLHLDPLQVAAETGIAGAVAIGLALVASWWRRGREGPLAFRGTGVSRRHPWRLGGPSGIRPVGPCAVRATGGDRRQSWRHRGVADFVSVTGTLGAVGRALPGGAAFAAGALALALHAGLHGTWSAGVGLALPLALLAAVAGADEPGGDGGDGPDSLRSTGAGGRGERRGGGEPLLAWHWVARAGLAVILVVSVAGWVAGATRMDGAADPVAGPGGGGGNPFSATAAAAGADRARREGATPDALAAAWERAVRLNPYQPAFQARLGEMLLLAGRPAEGRLRVRRAVAQYEGLLAIAGRRPLVGSPTLALWRADLRDLRELLAFQDSGAGREGADPPGTGPASGAAGGSPGTGLAAGVLGDGPGKGPATVVWGDSLGRGLSSRGREARSPVLVTLAEGPEAPLLPPGFASFLARRSPAARPVWLLADRRHLETRASQEWSFPACRWLVAFSPRAEAGPVVASTAMPVDLAWRLGGVPAEDLPAVVGEGCPEVDRWGGGAPSPFTGGNASPGGVGAEDPDERPAPGAVARARKIVAVVWTRTPTIPERERLARAGLPWQFSIRRHVGAGVVPAPFDAVADWPRLALYFDTLDRLE